MIPCIIFYTVLPYAMLLYDSWTSLFVMYQEEFDHHKDRLWRAIPFYDTIRTRDTLVSELQNLLQWTRRMGINVFMFVIKKFIPSNKVIKIFKIYYKHQWVVRQFHTLSYELNEYKTKSIIQERKTSHWEDRGGLRKKKSFCNSSVAHHGQGWNYHSLHIILLRYQIKRKRKLGLIIMRCWNPRYSTASSFMFQRLF